MVAYSPGPGAKVFFTGDSLTVDSSAQLRARLESRGLRVAGNAFGGTTIGWSASKLIDQTFGDPPAVAVVASGTNNVVGGWDAGDDAELATALQWAAKAPCAVWILPARVRYEVVGGVRRATVNPATLQMRDRIRSAATAAGVHVADWGALAAEHPDWYVPDGIHHTETGRAAYASFIARAVATFCPSV